MAVPATIADLSTTIASNSPAGSDNVFPDLDNYIRALSAFIAQIATGATQIGFGNGSAAAPSVTFQSDLDTGFYRYGANSVGVSIGGSIAAIFDANGRLGVGTSTPSYPLDIQTTGVLPGRFLGLTAGQLSKIAVQSDDRVLEIAQRSSTNAGGDLAYLNTTSATPIAFIVNGSEAMRVDTNQYALVGYTTSNGAYPLQVNGQIYATNASIATSDQKYKQHVQDVTGALATVNALHPVSFEWKKHEVHKFSDGRTLGFIAQEVQAALASSGFVDAIVRSNKCKLKSGQDEEFLGMSETLLIPLLVGAIQELSEAVLNLTAKSQAAPSGKP